MIFFNNDLKHIQRKDNFDIKKKEALLARNTRNILSYKYSLLKINVGDILIVFFWIKGQLFRFEGICISIKWRNILNVNTNLLLRNIISGVGVELLISYYYNRLFSLRFSDYKRKKSIYNRAKLYYLRNKLNIDSRIK